MHYTRLQYDENPTTGTPEWMITFGDLMALLLTFFVMLLSMSEFRSDTKFQSIAHSFERRFGQGREKQTMVREQLTAQAISAAHARRQALMETPVKISTIRR